MRIPDKVLQTINIAYTHIAQTRVESGIAIFWLPAEEWRWGLICHARLCYISLRGYFHGNYIFSYLLCAQ